MLFRSAATRGQYGKVLASDTMVDINGKANTTCIFGWWSLGYLHKASFILYFPKHCVNLEIYFEKPHGLCHVHLKSFMG